MQRKTAPGGWPSHWHWLGVPVRLWGTALLIRAILGLSIASRMAGGALHPDGPSSGSAGNDPSAVRRGWRGPRCSLGRRTIRCWYGQSGGGYLHGAGEGSAGPALVLGGDPGSAAWGIGFWIQAGCRAAPVPEVERSESSAVHEFGLETDPGQIYGNMIPSGCLNAHGGDRL